jgi:hypothetical protein
VNVISRFHNKWVPLTIFPIWIRRRTSPYTGGRVKKTWQATLGTDNLLRCLERVAFEVHLSTIKNGPFCLDPDALLKLVIGVQFSRLGGLICVFGVSKPSRLFLCSLSGNDDCGSHPRHLLITMHFSDDIMDDIVKGIIEDVACLRKSALMRLHSGGIVKKYDGLSCPDRGYPPI